MIVIVHPLAFESTAIWQAFLKEMQTLAKSNPKDSDVKKAIATAKAEIDSRGEP